MKPRGYRFPLVLRDTMPNALHACGMNPKSRAERFLEHLDGIFGVEPQFFPIESTIAGAPRVMAIVYQDIPEEGYITGVTFGLSEVEHPAWKNGRPELMVSVASNDLAWPLAVAKLASELRGRCPFSYGESINFGQPVSEDSEMSAFFVFAPAILGRDAYLNIDVGAAYPISIAGIYPIYGEELAVLKAIGLEAFWKHDDFEMFDVRRKRVEGAEERQRFQ